MSEKETFILADPTIEPTPERLQAILGPKYGWFTIICDHATDRYPQVNGTWRYYNDGKQWLFRLIKKKDTLFWTAVLAETFRITFYFPASMDTEIEASVLPEEVKELWRETSGSKFRHISLRMEHEDQVETACRLVDLKAGKKKVIWNDSN